jgi:hypothetical protein
MHSRPLGIFVSALIAVAMGCADRREPLARSHLDSQVAAQSSGSLTLSSFRKTNGYEQVRDGVKMYVLEWEAQIQVRNSGWKVGWNDFSLAATAPNALEAAVLGVTPKRLVRDWAVVLTGKSTLQNTEQGWRVLDATPTAAKIIPPPSREPDFLGRWQGYWVSYQQNREVEDKTPTFEFEITKLDGDRYDISRRLVGAPPRSTLSAFAVRLTEDGEMVGVGTPEAHYKLTIPTIKIAGPGQLRLSDGEGDIILKRVR